jgi:hypothetical protein
VNKTITVLILSVFILAFLFVLLPQADPAVREARNHEAIARSYDLTWFIRILMGITIVASAVGLKWIWNRAHTTHAHPETGLFPMIPAHWDRQHLNSDRVHTAAALASGGRVAIQAIKALAAEPEPLALPAPEATPLTASQIVDVNPVEKPHWLIVGQTGSGKSNATRHILTELTRRYDCQIAICEPGGVDWGMQVTARDDAGIARVFQNVYVEMLARQERLRQAGAQHISELPGMAYLFLLVEETEAILDNLRISDRKLAGDTLVAIRNIARMGRKTGIGLIAVTQAARTDVFDSHVRTNMGNLLLFRNSQGTAEMFRVDVHLANLPTGTAYSVPHGQLVSFPRVQVPRVPVVDERLLTTPTREETLFLEALPPPVVVSSPVIDADEVFRRQAWELYKKFKTYKGVQNALYPDQHDGGAHWIRIRAAVIEMKRRRGLKVDDES